MNSNPDYRSWLHYILTHLMFETYCLDCQVCPWGCSPLPFILLLSYCSTYLNIGPQGRSPSTLPQYWAPNSGAVPPLFYTTAILLHFLLQYQAPGPFPLYLTTILAPGAVPPNSWAVPPLFYKTTIILHYLLQYWAPGTFPLYPTTLFYHNTGPRGHSP